MSGLQLRDLNTFLLKHVISITRESPHPGLGYKCVICTKVMDASRPYSAAHLGPCHKDHYVHIKCLAHHVKEDKPMAHRCPECRATLFYVIEYNRSPASIVEQLEKQADKYATTKERKEFGKEREMRKEEEQQWLEFAVKDAEFEEKMKDVKAVVAQHAAAKEVTDEAEQQFSTPAQWMTMILSHQPRRPNTEAEMVAKTKEWAANKEKEYEVRTAKLKEFEAKKAEMKKMSASFGLWGSG
jgi:hypothetical protein